MALLNLPKEGVQRHLDAMDENPPTTEERQVACRSLMRYSRSSGETELESSEDWVRLYVALRRASGNALRVAPQILKSWKTRVKFIVSLLRKCYVVDRQALEALPRQPPGLNDFIIPRDAVVLPADIYAEDVVIVDDGFDRSLLNIPGVLHLEVSTTWQRERPRGVALAEGSGGRRPHLGAAPAVEGPGAAASAGAYLVADPAVEAPGAAESVGAPQLAGAARGSGEVVPAAAPAPAAVPPAPAAVPQAVGVVAPSEGGTSATGCIMDDIIANTMQAVKAGRWTCLDRRWVYFRRPHVWSCQSFAARDELSGRATTCALVANCSHSRLEFDHCVQIDA